MYSRKHIPIFILLILFIAVQFLYGMVPMWYNSTLLLITLIGVVGVLVLFISYREPEKAIRGNYLRIIFLFTLSYTIVHFQIYTDLLLGNTTIAEQTHIVSPGVINRSALLSLGGLISLLLGYIAYRRKRPLQHKVCNQIYPLSALKAIFVLIFLWFLVLNGTSFLAGTYGEANFLAAGTAAAYSEVFFGVFFYAIVFLNCRNFYLQGDTSLIKYIRSFGWIFNLCFCIYLFLVLVSGDRGPIIYSAGSYFASYVVASRKRYKLWVFTTLGCSIAVILTVLGIIRAMDRSASITSRLNEATIDSETYMHQSFIPFTTELAGSVKTLQYALEYVPDYYPFFYGMFTANNLVAAIPFAGRLIPLSIQHGGSGAFLTWIEQGDNPTSGTGTTVVADLYLDFAEYGVYLGLFLFGLLLRKIDLYLYVIGFNKMPLFYAIIYIVIIAKAIYIPRSSILFEFRSLIWTTLIVIAYQFFMRKYARKA